MLRPGVNEKVRLGDDDHTTHSLRTETVKRISQDLGADVDLVGPGPAYERWKKTPEYQQWLKDSGQLKERADAMPETGAFVVQGGTGVPERKLDTLADGTQALVVMEKTPGQMKQSVLEAVRFVPLKSGIA